MTFAPIKIDGTCPQCHEAGTLQGGINFMIVCTNCDHKESYKDRNKRMGIDKADSFVIAGQSNGNWCD